MNTRRHPLPSIVMAASIMVLWLSVGGKCSTIAAPTFQQLMDPSMFPDAQFGMRVELTGVQLNGLVRVTTTGAEVEILRDRITFIQRIGHKRVVALARVERPLVGVRVARQTTGLALVEIESPKMTIRVNGDSMCMIQPHEPLRIQIDRQVIPAYVQSYQKNHLVVDEWGGFALYCSEIALDDHFDTNEETMADYRLPADAVLCIGVCPPKPYNWKQSFTDQVVWHWSGKNAYPPDDVLQAWRSGGNIVLLQSEVMLWEDWNLDFIPRLGAAEFERVRETVHRLGMRFIVYTSPYYFLKGTDQESKAVNDQPGACPGAIGGGENMELFMQAIIRVMRDYKPDGLYFDGQYSNNPAALYALARRTRELLGPKGILEWHSSGGLGGGLCYMPHADAYTDFSLRGEGQNKLYSDPDFFRFFVSGYNVNNCIGVLCNNVGNNRPSQELLDRLLMANGRLHTHVVNDSADTYLPADYRSRLTPALRKEVDQQVDKRQAKLAQRVAEQTIKRRHLLDPPQWKSPLFEQVFAALPSVDRIVSPANTDPFSVSDGVFRINAHANTYAWLRFPLKIKAGGLLAKLRQGSDGGMFWGPGVMLKWANGSQLRVGVRSDQTLSVSCPSGQFDGGMHDPRKWVWLRARWTNGWCVIEQSADGHVYKRVWSFDPGGAFDGETAELLVGKVPSSGLPLDYAEPGPTGECEIESVRVY